MHATRGEKDTILFLDKITKGALTAPFTCNTTGMVTYFKMRFFEEVMAQFERGWGPLKQRGPCQCIEFMGLLISNVQG